MRKEQIENIVLEKVKQGVAGALTKEQVESMSISSYLDNLSDRLIAHVRWSTPGRVREIEFPASWWDYTKQRWFPKWALRRWPAKMNIVRAYQLFPDLPQPSGYRAIHFLERRL